MKSHKNPQVALQAGGGKASEMQTTMKTGYLSILWLSLQVLYIRSTILIN